jgi:hypothetical protein
MNGTSDKKSYLPHIVIEKFKTKTQYIGVIDKHLIHQKIQPIVVYACKRLKTNNIIAVIGLRQLVSSINAGLLRYLF